MTDRERLTAAFPDAPDRELVFKAMFGGACAYVNGRVFASLSNVGLALKADSATSEHWRAAGATPLQYEADGPVSKSYMRVPDAVLADEVKFARWVAVSAEYALSLPAPKKRKSSG